MAAMPNVAFPCLPNEILLTIFSCCYPNTLAIIARVSHHFRCIAERIMYSSISLNDTLSESSPQPWRTLRWCDSMLRRSYLFENTRKLQIRWHAVNPGSPISNSLIPACTEISQTLRLLTFLESLELFLGPANFMVHAPTGSEMHTIEYVIRDSHLPRLRHCSLGADYIKGVQHYTSVLPVFLASTPALRHLKLPDHHTPLHLPPWAIPDLSSFRGAADAAATLLPGRPVQALALVGQDSDVTRENLPRMTLTALPLRYLDLSAMSVRPALLKNVSTHFPTVQRLRVRLALRHTLHYAFSGILETPRGALIRSERPPSP
ncbi:hypothetical protein H2248_010495 [Termitomyces sp. 'cryptogamus']|nr:hypothetical protein H2248_010495 [Termitomyces sp. 'cryptogamus']